MPPMNEAADRPRYHLRAAVDDESDKEVQRVGDGDGHGSRPVSGRLYVAEVSPAKALAKLGHEQVGPVNLDLSGDAACAPVVNSLESPV